MNIKPKYDIGDEVYSIIFDTVSRKFISKKITIAEVNILKNKTGTFIRYSSQIWGSDSLFEDNLYKSEKDCIAECQRRNAGLSLSDMLFYALGMDSDGTVHAGGKRIRPLICCLTCGAISGSHEPALLPGTVLEMFHNFTLIHDDIEDLGETRHGQPAVWKKWGSALSLNAGDMLFALTYKTLHEISGRSKTGSEISVFDQMVTDLIMGQHLDISFEKRQSITEEEYLTMISGKTVALIKGSFTLGAIAAEADQSTIVELEKVGEKIGLAFQMQDDYLGIWGDSNHLGKSVSTDITGKKKSLPIQYAMDHDASFNKEWQEYNGDPERVGYFADRLREIGADSYTRNQWETAMSEASKKMKSFSFNEKYGNELNELIGTLAGRNK